MSARAAAQLQYLGYRSVYHYLRGKADWIVRGLPTEPARAPVSERWRALPYFINNLAPGLRAAWIALSRRVTVARFTRDTLLKLTPADAIPERLAESLPGQMGAGLGRLPRSCLIPRPFCSERSSALSQGKPHPMR
jgi:hypothetical protein